MSRLRVLAALFLSGVFALTIVLDLGAEAQTAAAVALTVYLWATMLVPEFYTALIFIAIVLIFGIAADDVALAGFQSKAVWLVFAGIVLGAAIQKHEIGGALFDRVLGSLRSYAMLIWSVALTVLLLSFIIPSAMGRVVLIAPIVATLCDRLGLGKTSNERTAVYLTAILGTTLPAFTILTSNVPNLVLLGATDANYGRTISYMDYLFLNFPVLGLGAFLLLPIIVLFMFPGSLSSDRELPQPQAWSPAQRQLSLLLLVTVALWATDKLHGISAAWIGLGAALISMAPRFGVIAPSVIKDLNFGPWFFVAGSIGLGAVVQDSGLGLSLWTQVSSHAPLADLPSPVQFAALVIGTIALPIFTTLPAAPSIFVPLAGSIAETINWPVESVILAQVPSFILFAFPYQAPPVLVGATLLGMSLRNSMKLLGAITLVGVIVLIPLHYLWGHLLGVFP